MSVAPKKRMGRPPKDPVERKRHNQTVRVREVVRDRLKDASEKAQRSISEEIEARLERSFEQEDRAGSAEDQRLLRYMEATLYDVRAWLKVDWAKGDDLAKVVIRTAMEDVLRRLMRVDPLPEAKSGDPETAHASQMREVAERVGRTIAGRIVALDYMAEMMGPLNALHNLTRSPEDKDLLSQLTAVLDEQRYKEPPAKS
jgi:hypothetical protein